MTPPASARLRPGRGRAVHGAVASLLAVLAAAAVLVLGALPASAHTELLGVTPAPGEVVVEGAQVTVTLTFTEAIDPAFATVVVVDSVGQVVPADPVRVNGADVTQPVAALAPGEYAIRYRVVSADGHPVDGESAFSVQAAAQPTPAPEPAPAAAPEPDADTTATPSPEDAAGTDVGTDVLTGGAADTDNGSALPLGLGAAALAAAVGGGAVAARRRAAGPKDPSVDG